jgi:hypothetical protein
MKRMIFCIVMLTGSISVSASGAPNQSPFDPPAETRREKLAPDPQKPGLERTVSCFDYPRFTIRQVDLGEVGAATLSIIPSAPGKKPACAEQPQDGEYEIPNELWSGYFVGVKGDYAFFDAGDGTNGGLGFMVFQVSSKKKLFDDMADGGLESVTIKDDAVTLRYRRNFSGPCSVVTGAAACSERLAREMGVASIPSATCAESYASTKRDMAKARCEATPANGAECVAKELKLLDEQKWDEAPTVLVYDVEATLGKGAAKIEARGEPKACHPSN